ncbi:hypothetical protein A8V01_18120 [Novosphingobium guangzhouense]|uniref:Uncharacterized protein n=1 Tax=Novosphingobium guangzhouense TaxID=1850347 RepID=A0A2K2G1B7_9SPHN|nr:hypothetical protein A8V01_18120 [Novosphingobium guangzhouense]
MRAAAAQVPTHPLAKFLMAERHIRGIEIISYMAWDAAPDFIRHADRGANLAGGAIAALEAVMVYECLLERVQIGG